MTLTELINELYNRSEFTNPSTLAAATDNTQPFAANFIEGSKAARKKEDRIFDALTEGVTVEMIIAALDLIEAIKQQQIEDEQML
jgi:hypothetical protein